jgi:hypothetical protein
VTIEAQIVTAVKNAGIAIFPNAAPQDQAAPFVVYRLTDHFELMTLQGPTGDVKDTFTFESWADTKGGAATLKAGVTAAINAAFGTLSGHPEEPGSSGYDPDSDQHMEPCAFSFWHR